MSDSLRTNDHIQQVVNEYADMLLRIAFTHLANRQDAEDVVQSVFLKYIEKQPSFAGKEHEKAWFIRVSTNLCKNHRQAAWFKRTVQLDEKIGYPAFNQEEIDEQIIFDAVLNLPQKYRMVIYLFYYEDYSNQQIAKICDMKEATVRSQLFRARKLLKASLEGAFLDE